MAVLSVKEGDRTKKKEGEKKKEEMIHEIRIRRKKKEDEELTERGWAWKEVSSSSGKKK